jgi:arylsulfatase A-like enzyme
LDSSDTLPGKQVTETHSGSPETKPNVVLVITDDQGYGDLACHGNPTLKTPNIDAFFDESVRLTNFHVGPTCAPTRAGLYTGRYANSTGVWHTVGGRSLLSKDELTIASAMRTSGYHTGLFGKWHLGDAFPYRPQDRGFEEVFTHGGGGISQTPDYWGNDYFDDTYVVNGTHRTFEGYCTDVWFREAIQFIEDHQEDPFFCVVSPNAPHSPYNVETRYSEPYQNLVPDERARFYGMITNIDENFGYLTQALQKHGLHDNTIVIFMTDNGSSGGVDLDEEGFPTGGFNSGMRGMKGSQYDGGHRVPFFIRWPNGRINGGRDVTTLTANIDVMPTLLDMCAAEVTPLLPFHGRSVRPLLENSSASWPERTIVTDSQRLARPVKWRQSAVMTDRWRLVDGKELYDVDADPGQLADVAAKHKDQVNALRTAYETWWESVSEQIDRDIPITLGASPQQETILNAHDWRNDPVDCPWNQGAIRSGETSNGYWEVDIAEPGCYAFELRRWPKEAPRAINAGINGDDIVWRPEWIPKTFHEWYTNGVALPVTSARIKVLRNDELTLEEESIVSKDALAAHFFIQLQAGPAHFMTEFLGDEGLSVGAYYVYVHRMVGSPNAE